MIEPGTPAPPFRALSSHGQTLDSGAFADKLPVVLFFVGEPAADDALNEIERFDGLLKEFGERRVQLLGVTPVKPRALRNFVDEHQLTLTLLADEAGNIARDFEISLEGDAGGRTVILDREWTVAETIDVTDPARHPDTVLTEVDRLFSLS